MKIRDIITEDLYFTGNINAEISGIAYDSRMVRPGDLFVAIKGENSDGHNYIEDSIKRGASAIVFEKENFNPTLIDKYSDIAWIGTNNSRDTLSRLACNFYNNPSSRITLIGITGTNGKTTTSYIIKKILEIGGYNVGLIGTIGYFIKDAFFEAHHTTPESPDFQYFLRRMVDDGCNYIISEVSSHALIQKRVDYSEFKIAVFTNLTHDHLDFHKTMEDYYRAKKRLFTELLVNGGTAVINIDNHYGLRLLKDIQTERGKFIKCLTVGIENNDAHVKAYNIKSTFKDISFKLRYDYIKNENEVFRASLIGLPNVYNLLSGIATAISLGLPIDLIRKAISDVKPVEGRFQRIDAGQNFLALIDYAHTDDAISGLLKTARRLIEDKQQDKKGKIITVFGCGGNRDRAKRPKMAEIATRLSDLVIMTTDNPRYEDPTDILRDMEKGVVNGNYMIIPDRRLAIQMAVDNASKGDILIVAGKGHEDYQEIKGVRTKFSDKIELEKAISIKKGKKNVFIP